MGSTGASGRLLGLPGSRCGKRKSRSQMSDVTSLEPIVPNLGRQPHPWIVKPAESRRICRETNVHSNNPAYKETERYKANPKPQVKRLNILNDNIGIDLSLGQLVAVLLEVARIVPLQSGG